MLIGQKIESSSIVGYSSIIEKGSIKIDITLIITELKMPYKDSEFCYNLLVSVPTKENLIANSIEQKLLNGIEKKLLKVNFDNMPQSDIIKETINVEKEIISYIETMHK